MNENKIPNKFSGKDCIFCREALLDIGEKSEYGAVVIFKIGKSKENGCFATLSPKTAGNPDKDFSIQLIPFKHLRNFSEINNTELSKNYGIAFGKISYAISNILEEDFENGEPKNNEWGSKNAIGTYGKCKYVDEHIHVKLFPYRGIIGQPFTLDSTYEKKEKFIDSETNEEYVKMKPIKKVFIPKERFEYLKSRFIELLN